MKFDATVTYPAPLDAVWSMLRDEKFHKSRLQAAHVKADHIEIVDEGDAFTAVVEMMQDASDVKIPSMAKRFLPSDGIRATISERWDTTTCEGVLTVDLGGLPVQFVATSHLNDDGSSVTRTVSGDLTVKVPMIGKKLESEAIKQVSRIVTAEEQAANNYLN